MMKRLLTFVSVWLLTAMQLAAQNIEVMGFNPVPNSTLANTQGYIVKDRNDKKCAIIKVQTTLRGLHFDVGNKHVAKQEDPTAEHPSETWIWVSPGSQKITISHQNFGQCTYQIPINIESAKTYEMKIKIGSARFVQIRTAPIDGASLKIDGNEVGPSPVYNYPLDFGTHTIVATKDKYEGSLERVITENDVDYQTVIQVQMKDMSDQYGEVTVKTDENAGIYLNGDWKGTGKWQTELKAGTYTVETRKADCDPQTTTFTVRAREKNEIVANAPIQHTGFLNIFIGPRIKATIDGKDIDLVERQQVPVGKHVLEFTRKGYHSQIREYTVERNKETKDNVELERINYVKPLAFYFGGGYTVGSVMGITGILGAVIYRNDLQLSYTFGTAETDPIHWYGNNGTWLSTTKYKKRALAVKYGYQFNLQEMLAITPQVGFSHVGLNGTVNDGTGNYADGASAKIATIGVKLLLVPVHHLYVFAAPQYGVTLSKSTNFDLLSSHSDISVDGFSATLGVLFNF